MAMISTANIEQQKDVLSISSFTHARTSKFSNEKMDTSQLGNLFAPSSKDFGLAMSKPMDDATRKDLLESPWTPDFKFKFKPSGNRNLKFQLKWMTEWRWLVYSPEQDSAYCKYCSLFATTVGHQSSYAGNLVKKPFRDWKDAKSEFNKHANTRYHAQCMERAANFLETYTGLKESVDISLYRELKSQIERNRECLKPIIETAIFLARLGIAFRGHQDSGPLNLEESPKKGEGKFRSLLKFRAEAGDQALKEHLSTGGSNAIYISWQLQNEIISSLNVIILNKLVERVNQAKFFSIMCDETTDVSGTVQLAVCARFVENFVVHEEFLQLISVKDCTGAGLANTICTTMDEVGLETKKLVGQGYDGAAAMSGALRGVQQKHKKAQYVHCSSHSFNLALSQLCNLPQIRNCMGTIETARNFFKFPKWQNVLQDEINKMQEMPRAQKLKRMCPTRWVERHDSLRSFIELLEPMLAALDVIAGLWSNRKTATDARMLACAICNCDFLIALYVIEPVFEITLPLSKYLQTVNLDLRLAVNSAMSLKASLENMRQNAEECFHTIFKKASDVCREFSVAVVQPRVVGRQMLRCNTPADTPEEYYRRAFYIPFLDETVSTIDDKFISHKELLQPFQSLLAAVGPGKAGFPISDESVRELMNLAEFYDLHTDIKGELILWVHFVQGLKQIPQSAIDALQKCNVNMFPTVHDLLTIMATLPVTTCTCERSFSTLKLLKTYLRNTTGEDRLNGLALTYINDNISVSPEEVLDNLAKKPRRLNIRLR